MLRREEIYLNYRLILRLLKRARDYNIPISIPSSKNIRGSTIFDIFHLSNEWESIIELFTDTRDNGIGITARGVEIDSELLNEDIFSSGYGITDFLAGGGIGIPKTDDEMHIINILRRYISKEIPDSSKEELEYFIECCLNTLNCSKYYVNDSVMYQDQQYWWEGGEFTDEDEEAFLAEYGKPVCEFNSYEFTNYCVKEYRLKNGVKALHDMLRNSSYKKKYKELFHTYGSDWVGHGFTMIEKEKDLIFLFYYSYENTSYECVPYFFNTVKEMATQEEMDAMERDNTKMTDLLSRIPEPFLEVMSFLNCIAEKVQHQLVA